MPTRILRDGILSSERVALLAWPEEVFYRRLMSVVDDYGRFSAHQSLIRAACYPLKLDKVSDSDVGKWLTACVNAALVRVYPAQDGKRYLELLDFGQRVQSKSKYPGPADSRDSTVTHGDSPEITALVGVVVEVERAEEPKGSLSAKAVAPNCPHDEIVALYHEHLPANPRIKVWDGSRADALRTRWREDGKRQSLDYWQRFFTYVAKSEFLTGKREGSNGRPFTPGLEWLVKSANFAKVIEGRYHEEVTA